jgi:hypothetical protein
LRRREQWKKTAAQQKDRDTTHAHESSV